MDEILAALESIESKGSFSAEKSTSSNDFDIKFNKIGTLTLPISEQQIKELIGIAQPAKFGWRNQTILDKEVRNVWEISKNKIKIGKKQWSNKFDPMLEHFKNALGLPKNSALTAELHNMLIYEKGNFFKPHQDTEKMDGMVATLVVVLPTAHQGGELIVDHRGKKKIYQFQTTDKLSCVAFYADCHHEVKEVTSGYRVSLTYNLILKNYKGNIETLYESDFNSRLENALKNYFFQTADKAETGYFYVKKPKKMVYLLDHEYTQHSLTWNALKNVDQLRVNALLNIADHLGLEAHLTLADMKETWDCEFDYDEYRYRRKYRHYDDDEDEEEGTPVSLMDTETTLRHWVNREGKIEAYKDFTPGSNETCWTGENEGFKPYDSEYEEWMGNYGNTLDKWYHRAAIILWKEDDHYPVLFEIDQDSFIKEIFLLKESKEELSKLRDMLRYAAAYWERYAREHAKDEDITRILELVLYLNDAEISKDLLTAYNISILNTKNLALWVKLISQYGDEWVIQFFTEITSREKYRRDDVAIIGFSELIQLLKIQVIQPTVINWLVDYQFAILKLKHEKQRGHDIHRQRDDSNSNRIAEITDFLFGAIFSGNKKIHVKMLNNLMEHGDLYSALSLVKLLEMCIEKIDTSEIKSWGYDKLFDYLHKSVIDEYQLGLRNKDDWNINVKSSRCTCANCKLLIHFLNAPGEQQKIWPLVEHSRDHIESEVSILGIPVTCRVEKTSRPYKLILTKTSALYGEAEKRYVSLEKAISQLNKLDMTPELR